jgi:dipeptidyl aminopeptidase/acylaminoacyl peptidase
MKYVIFIAVGLFLTITYFFLNIADNSTQIQNTTTQEIKNDEIDSPISILKLRKKKIESPPYKIEKRLENGTNYEKYVVSYLSEGEKVYALLTVPMENKPEKGFPAIIFNHGYIPPKSYSTLSNYADYVDYLARKGFVVLKIDMRGHGNSEGIASGTYFSSTYTIDVISALKSLQKSEIVNPQRIGVWGHSMSGNLVLRSMLVSEDIKAGVIWAGAVYSYEDFKKYRISDSSYTARPATQIPKSPNRDSNPEILKIRDAKSEIDFKNEYWKAISLTQNLNYLKNPLQIHHAVNDNVVNVGYSRDLEIKLKENNINYEYFEYQGGGHNITGLYFNQAMERTVEFFKKNL